MGWISIVDRLPPLGKNVLFCGKGHTGREALLGSLHKDGWHDSVDGELWPAYAVSHWQELPELPFSYSSETVDPDHHDVSPNGRAGHEA